MGRVSARREPSSVDITGLNFRTRRLIYDLSSHFNIPLYTGEQEQRQARSQVMLSRCGL